MTAGERRRPLPSSWAAPLRRALLPAPQPWAVRPALRAVATAGIVLGGSLLVADLRIGGIAYFGVACAAVFIGRDDYRTRAAMVGAQALGAAVGMTVGALVPATAAWVIAAAVAVGVVAGAVGRIGPASTACSVMAVIGVAYTQFGRLAMPWWEPVLLYGAGSALLLAVGMGGALAHRERYRDAAVSAVFAAAADLLEAGPSTAAEARHRLAMASAAARQAALAYRRRPGRIGHAWADARNAAALAAELSVAPGPEATREALVQRWRTRTAHLHAGAETSTAGAPFPGIGPRARVLVRIATGREALRMGARLGVCVGAATALAVLLHPPQHAFWIPLTVATVLRPEYGAVLVRSVHRLAGTLVGVLAVVGLLALTSAPAWLSVGASLALGLAVLAGPRLYGLAVVGVTGSALLSIAVGSPLDFEPWPRLLDTVLGCAIALVAGVLLWPHRGLPDQARAFADATAALARQLDLELRPVTAPGRAAADDDAYRLAHTWRAELERDLAEPDPDHAAARWLPVALQLERAVDAVCAAGTQVRNTPEGSSDGRRTDLLDLISNRSGPDTTPVQAERLLTALLTRLA